MDSFSGLFRRARGDTFLHIEPPSSYLTVRAGGSIILRAVTNYAFRSFPPYKRKKKRILKHSSPISDIVALTFVWWFLSVFFKFFLFFASLSMVHAAQVSSCNPKLPLTTTSASKQNLPAELVSHHATYSIECVGSGDALTPRGLGKLTLEMVQYGDNWILKETSNLHVAIPGIPEGEKTSTILNTCEDLSGSNYQFAAQVTHADGTIEENIEGRARLVGENGEGTIVCKQPDNVTISLPAGTIFPITHLKRLIKQAQNITRPRQIEMLKSTVFDGSNDVQNAVRIEAVITSVDPNTLHFAINDPSVIANHSLWRAELSVYALFDREEEPEYKIYQIFSDQGILFEVVVDYGDYKMISKLKDLHIFTNENEAQRSLRMES